MPTILLDDTCVSIHSHFLLRARMIHSGASSVIGRPSKSSRSARSNLLAARPAVIAGQDGKRSVSVQFLMPLDSSDANARIEALRVSLAVLAVLATIAIFMTRLLPTTPAGRRDHDPTTD